ncbi:Lysophospholipase, catalytic domain protein [Metarhizium guizhouense ARSEF 977]|uniref:Lysophospholipase n=1 Tax=Metarhizium guizhouense (strain ARSEF 977) TaxID=1276136 RepID=A0A0B4HRZ4_METGA|nr:Lysophospholipase, catalytic domain protein [Metarhizium guizhouense ARSEF 977]
MHHPTLILAAASSLSGITPPWFAHAAAVYPGSGPPQAFSLEERATPQAPDGYAPAAVDCPSTRPEIRVGSSLSPQEKEWLPRRRTETISHIRDFLQRNAIPGFDSEKYLSGATANSTALPNIGIAVSGGGYRAMLNGAGAVAAFDSRSPGSTSKGNIGGLLQSPKGFKDYYKTIFDEADKKHDAGFNRSITDYWGRMLSFQLVNAEGGGPSYTFSSIADDSDFSAAKAPLPFLVADSRAPGEKNTTIDDALFEFNPWELGSTDPSLNGFVPLKYVGSKFNNGKLPDSEKCIAGFDNVGFVMGTSSSLFNQIILRLKDSNGSKYIPADVPKFVVKIILEILTALGDADDDIADWTPNPFKGWNKAVNKAATSDRLTLVDGGEDGQNVPYHPHLLLERKVDVVFSVDSSADTNAWPDGAAPMRTYERSLSPVSNGTSFPVVPGRNSFINLGLNTKPTFFGCNATNTTNAAPLIVYLPNYPYQFHSNISTFSLSVNNSERDAMISNGWAVVTQLNGTRDADWPTCVSCAMLQRSFERTKTPIPDKCNQCFSRYCWNGTIDERPPAKMYEPQLYGTAVDVKGTSKSAGLRLLGSASAALATVAACLAITL